MKHRDIGFLLMVTLYPFEFEDYLGEELSSIRKSSEELKNFNSRREKIGFLFKNLEKEKQYYPDSSWVDVYLNEDTDTIKELVNIILMKKQSSLSLFSMNEELIEVLKDNIRHKFLYNFYERESIFGLKDIDFLSFIKNLALLYLVCLSIESGLDLLSFDRIIFTDNDRKFILKLLNNFKKQKTSSNFIRILYPYVINLLTKKKDDTLELFSQIGLYVLSLLIEDKEAIKPYFMRLPYKYYQQFLKIYDTIKTKKNKEITRFIKENLPLLQT